MGSSVPVRDLAGKIVGLRSEKEVDAVQETLDASLKAVGATPTAQQTSPSSMESENPQRPSSWRLYSSQGEPKRRHDHLLFLDQL